MASIAPAAARFTSEEYFALVDQGALRPDDRVELLEGVIVAMAPQSPRHAASVSLAARAIFRAVGERAAIRIQLPFVAGAHSVPEPDVAVVPGRESDYATAHPSVALLVIEVADSTLPQDRLSKAGIYAAAGVPEYWLVNLRDEVIEVFRSLDPQTARYAATRIARRGEHIELDALPGATVTVAALLPER